MGTSKVAKILGLSIVVAAIVVACESRSVLRSNPSTQGALNAQLLPQPEAQKYFVKLSWPQIDDAAVSVLRMKVGESEETSSRKIAILPPHSREFIDKTSNEPGLFRYWLETQSKMSTPDLRAEIKIPKDCAPISGIRWSNDISGCQRLFLAEGANLLLYGVQPRIQVDEIVALGKGATIGTYLHDSEDFLKAPIEPESYRRFPEMIKISAERGSGTLNVNAFGRNEVPQSSRPEASPEVSVVIHQDSPITINLKRRTGATLDWLRRNDLRKSEPPGEKKDYRNAYIRMGTARNLSLGKFLAPLSQFRGLYTGQVIPRAGADKKDITLYYFVDFKGTVLAIMTVPGFPPSAGVETLRGQIFETFEQTFTEKMPIPTRDETKLNALGLGALERADQKLLILEKRLFPHRIPVGFLFIEFDSFDTLDATQLDLLEQFAKDPEPLVRFMKKNGLASFAVSARPSKTFIRFEETLVLPPKLSLSPDQIMRQLKSGELEVLPAKHYHRLLGEVPPVLDDSRSWDSDSERRRFFP